MNDISARGVVCVAPNCMLPAEFVVDDGEISYHCGCVLINLFLMNPSIKISALYFSDIEISFPSAWNSSGGRDEADPY